MEDFGKMLIGFGIAIALLGGIIALGGRIPVIGRLPDDIVLQNENLSCLFPLASSIVVSIALTLVLNLLIHIFNR